MNNMKTNNCPWCIAGIDNCHCTQEEIDQYYKDQEDHHTKVLSDALMEDITEFQKKAAIVDELMWVIPFGNINTHTIDNLVERIQYFIQEYARLRLIEEKLMPIVDMINEDNK
jgi:hypothetical protein